MLALAWALDHFEPYIYGQTFLVRTDNRALSWLKTTKNMRGPASRWLERIMDFMPFEIDIVREKIIQMLTVCRDCRGIELNRLMTNLQFPNHTPT